jgi:hypothetical protein
VSVPPGSGTVPVRIETGGGLSPVSPAAMFTYYPRPVVTAVTPSSGPAAGGGTVTITGTGLADPLEVVVGDTATVLAATDTAVTVVVPPRSPGDTVPVQVRTRGGWSDFDITYSYE